MDYEGFYSVVEALVVIGLIVTMLIVLDRDKEP